MKTTDKLQLLKSKAVELGLRADFWNPIVLVITPPPDGEEEKQLLSGLDPAVSGRDREEGRPGGDGQGESQGPGADPTGAT